MTKDEVLRMALEALDIVKRHYTQNRHVNEAITAIKEALAQPEQDADRFCDANCTWSDHHPDCKYGKPEQEPVAWLHTKIEGVAVPHRPADLDKHPDRWEALYKTPSPCPTCEALARTVMLDQTSYDTTQPQRTWVGLTDEEKNAMTWGNDIYRILELAEAKLKEKNT